MTRFHTEHYTHLSRASMRKAAIAARNANALLYVMHDTPSRDINLGFVSSNGTFLSRAVSDNAPRRIAYAVDMLINDRAEWLQDDPAAYREFIQDWRRRRIQTAKLYGDTANRLP